MVQPEAAAVIVTWVPVPWTTEVGAAETVNFLVCALALGGVWLVSFALRKRLVVAMVCVFAAIYGYYSCTELAIEAYPDVADTASQVVTQKGSDVANFTQLAERIRSDARGRRPQRTSAATR